MKKILTIALLLTSVNAFAQSELPVVTNSTQSSAVGTATNAGNAQSITFTSPPVTTQHVEYSGTQTIRNVPSVSGPPLISSNDTCMGSASGSANAPGFGISLGKTYTDSNCVMLKNAREMWNMGMRAAAMALMCNDASNKEALESTGFKCPIAGQRPVVETKIEPKTYEPKKVVSIPDRS